MICAAARCWASCPRPTCPTIANITRSAGSRPRASRSEDAVASPAQSVAFGTDLIFEAADRPDFVFARRDLRGLLGAAAAVDAGGAGRGAHPLQPLGLQHHHRQGRRARPCCAPASPRAAWRPMSSPPRAGAKAPPTSPGTARRRSTNWARSWPRPSASRCDSQLTRRRRRRRAHRLERLRNGTFGDCAAAAGQAESRSAASASRIEPGDGPTSGSAAPARPLPLRAGRPGAARPGLLRGLQHPGPGPGAAADRPPAVKHARHRRLGRARFDPGPARRRRAFDRLGLPRTDILGFTMPGFATSEGTKSNAWALMKALGVTGAEIDIRPAAEQMLARHRPSLRQGRAGLRHHLRERAGGPAHRLSVPPRQPARRLRARHRRPVGAGAGLVHLWRRRPHEPLQRQRRRWRRR